MSIVERLVPRRLGHEFRTLLAASWITNAGDGLALAASPLLVASQTHDPFLVALAPMLQQLPWLLFGLYAGAVADRVDRRLLLVGANLARAFFLSVLLVFLVTGHVNVAVVLAAALVLGTAEVFVDTTTSTLTPMLVAKPDLGIANSRVFAGFLTVNQLAGPPVGAALFALGMAWPFAGQLVCVLLGAMLVSRLRLPVHGKERHERTHVRADIAEGLRWLWHSPPVRTLALVIVTFNVTFGAALGVLVLYSTEHLDMGAVGFGLLTTASAIGGLIGTTAYGWLERHVPLGTLMKTCLLLEVFFHLALALATEPWQAIVTLFGFGCYAFVWGTLSMSVRQRAVPQELQGRVASVYLVGVFGGIVAGNLLGGLIAREWGITGPYWFGFVGTGVFLALIWPQLKLIVHADEEATAAG